MYISSPKFVTFTETSIFPENQAGRALTRSFTLSFLSEAIRLASSVTLVTDLVRNANQGLLGPTGPTGFQSGFQFFSNLFFRNV